MAQPNTRPDDLPTPSAVALIADLAQKAHEAQLLNIPTNGLEPGLPATVPALFDPKSGGVASLKRAIEDYRLAPRAREGKALALTLASFIALVDRHMDDDSAIFADTRWPSPKLVAVIDYHTAGPDHAPRHGRHRVVYEFPITDEFKAWQTANGFVMPQAEFAAFLEEHAAELASPTDGERSEFERLFSEAFATPSEVLRLSRDLEVFVGARVKRQERLSSGERTVEFVEEHSTANGEKVTIPGIFMVSVPAFVDGEPVRIPARLRYRLAGSDIKWFFQLYRWEFWLRERVQQDLAAVGEATGAPTFEGLPEAIERGA